MIAARRIVPALALLVGVGGVARAERLTCEQFKDKLTDVIRSQGDRVAVPKGFSVAFKQEGNPHIRYEFGGILGLTGNLNCQREDAFQDIDFGAKFEDGAISEYAGRIQHLVDLTSAAVCVLEPRASKGCLAIARRAHSKALADFLAQKERGEESPHGNYYEDISPRTQVDWTIIPGGMLVTVSNKATDIY